MLGHNHQLAEIISNKICKQLTSHMDYKALKLNLENSRQPKINDQAIQFIHTTTDHIRYLDNLEPERNESYEAINYDMVSKTKEMSFGKRVSIVRVRRSTLMHKKSPSPTRMSKRMLRGIKQKQKGLIKLPTSEDEEQNFADYIEKLRQKKIKFAEVMELFNQEGLCKQNIKQFKTTARETNHTERPIITTLTGQVVKCEKKQQNAKKDEIYLQKVRIRPLFKLRQHVSSRADLFRKGQMPTEARRVSISNEVRDGQNYTPKDDNYYIKSIIDVIANRKQQEVRRRKNNMR